MNKLLDYLNENSMGQFATIKDGKPVMRPFKFLFQRGGKFYFLTSNTKEVYKQLRSSGVAGFAVIGKDTKWVRLNGEIQFVDSLELKKEALNSEPMIRNVYKTADNPILEMFHITKGVASFHKGDGEVIEEIKI